jgi:hypothetical protein
MDDEKDIKGKETKRKQKEKKCGTEEGNERDTKGFSLRCSSSLKSSDYLLIS